MNDKKVEEFYDALHATYDTFQLVRKPADRLVVNAGIFPEQKVLDVACGTGWAAMAAAKIVGNRGRVIGIDMHRPMINAAKEKAASAGLSNVEYHTGDAAALEFEDSTFDAVICASSIMLFSDISKALNEWHRVLRAGGTVAFTSFGESFLQPVLKPLGALLSRYDGQPPPVPFFIESTNTPDKCRELLKGTDFGEIEITTEKLDCQYPDITAYWQEITQTFVGPRLANLGHVELEKFKMEHLSEIESMYANHVISIEFPTIFSVAKKR